MIRRPVRRHARERGINLEGDTGLMEKRAIIAALLMAGLLIAYQTFFMQSPETPLAPKAEAPGPKPGASPVPAPVAVAVPSPVPVAAVPLRTARVDEIGRASGR